MIPNSGKSTTGSKEVTASGTASVIYHTAMSKATASVLVTAGSPGLISVKRMINREISGTIKKLKMYLIFK
jgi:hypothetical protein